MVRAGSAAKLETARSAKPAWTARQDFIFMGGFGLRLGWANGGGMPGGTGSLPISDSIRRGQGFRQLDRIISLRTNDRWFFHGGASGDCGCPPQIIQSSIALLRLDISPRPELHPS